MKKTMIKKIVVVGLGLMGGSLAAALRKKFPKTKVVGVARRAAVIAFARKKKWIEAGGSSLKDMLRGADLVVLCLPVDLLPKALNKIEKEAEASVLVTDVGSVKAPLERFVAKKKWKRVRFVGAHPMVGSHEKGIRAARSNLYDQGLTVITPSHDQAAFRAVKAFWEKVSRKVVCLDAKEHDRRVALVSHLPHLLSVCLLGAVGFDKARDISSTGFRDMTRLAKGDPSIWAPIFIQNREAVLEAIELFQSNLMQFRSSLIKISEKRLAKILTKTSKLGA